MDRLQFIIVIHPIHNEEKKMEIRRKPVHKFARGKNIQYNENEVF